MRWGVEEEGLSEWVWVGGVGWVGLGGWSGWGWWGEVG